MPKAPERLSKQHTLYSDFAKSLSKVAPLIERALLLSKYNTIPATQRGPFSFDLVFLFIKQLHQPYVTQFEGNWSDNKSDNGGATMKGVTLKTFRRKFEKYFDARKYGLNIPAYDALFDKVIQTNYKQDDVAGKDLLYTVCSLNSSMHVFLASYYTTDDIGSGILLSTYDPYIGFLIVDKSWMSGGYAWSNNVKDGSIYSAANKLGYNGPTPHYASPSFIQWYKSLNPIGTSNWKTPEFSKELIQSYVNHAYGLAKSKASQKKFLDGWITRFVGSNKDKRLNMMNISARWIEILSTLELT